MLWEKNVELFFLINSFNSELFDYFFLFVTQLGSGYFAIFLAFVFYFVKRDKVLPIVVSYILSGLIVQFVKNTWHTPRPPAIFENVHIVGEPLYYGSFPSGHTATAMALFYVLSYKEHFFIKLLLFLVAFLVGYSRIYIGVHFPLDVLAGATIGIVCGYVAIKYREFISNHKKEFFVFTLVFALLFYKLGEFPFYVIDEAKNAEAAREMLEREDFIVPTFNYQLRTDKPPLHYWFFMLFYELFGVSEFSARFASPILGTALAFITYRFSKNFLDRNLAVKSAFILATSLYFFLLFRMSVPDPFLVLTNSVALFSFYCWFSYREPEYVYVFWIFLGVSFLAKGPAGFGIPLAIAFLFLLFYKPQDIKLFVSKHHILGFFISLLVALPWYVAVYIETHGEFIKGFFFHHNLERFTSHIAGPKAPFVVVFIYLLIGLFPWSFFIPQVIFRALKNFKDSFTLFLLVWVGVYFFVYSVSVTKLPHYFVPMYPALSILTARYMQGRFQKFSLVGIASVAFLLAFLAINIANMPVQTLLHYLSIIFSEKSIPNYSEAVIQVVKSVSLGVALACVPLLIVGILAFFKKVDTVFGLATAFALTLFILTSSIVPKSKAFFTPKHISDAILNYEESQKVKLKEIYYHKYFDPSLVFYTRKKFIPLESVDSLPEDSLLVIDKRYLKESVSYKIIAEFKDVLKNREVLIIER